VRFFLAVRAEWTKLRTTSGPAWLLLLAATGTVAMSAVVPSAPLSGVYLGQIPVAVLAVIVVSGEYSTTLIRTTLTAVPNRAVVLAAKALVLAGMVAVVGGATVFACLLLFGSGFRPWAGSVVYLVLIALLSLGVATVVRDPAAAIGTVLGLLYLPPVLIQLITDPDLRRRLEQIAPMNAGLAVTDLVDVPIGPWAGLGVLATWSAGALVAGILLFRARDT
jgi:ABC-2 type transport system permease protein